MSGPYSDTLIVIVLMAAVLLRLLLVALVAWLIIPRRRGCPQCGDAVFPVQGPLILSLLVLERRWCLGCGWSGVARKFPRVASGAAVPPGVPIASIAGLFLLSASACQPRGDPVAQLFSGPATWVDLTHQFDEKTIYWPTAQPFKLTVVADGMTPGGYYYSAANFSAAEHGGTHLDAPVHFAQGHHTADQIPLEQLIGPAVVVDVSAKASSDADYRIDAQDLRAFEAKLGRIPDGGIVLFRTGWGSRWPDRKAYLGTEATGQRAVAELHFPGIDSTAARWLVAERTIDAVGIDTPSIDYGQSTTFRVHRILFEANIPAFENVANLDTLPLTGAYVVALPMKIAGGTGGPLRIVAAIPQVRQ